MEVQATLHRVVPVDPDGFWLDTTDHFVPVHRSVRLPPELREPTATQLLALAQATPLSKPATEAAARCRGAAAAAVTDEPTIAAIRPAASDTHAVRKNLWLGRACQDIPEMLNTTKPPTPGP